MKPSRGWCASIKEKSRISQSNLRIADDGKARFWKSYLTSSCRQCLYAWKRIPAFAINLIYLSRSLTCTDKHGVRSLLVVTGVGVFSGTFKVVFPFRLWKVSNLYKLVILNLVENISAGPFIALWTFLSNKAFSHSLSVFACTWRDITLSAFSFRLSRK